MAEKYTSVEQYISQIPEQFRKGFEELYKTVKNIIPQGFVDTLQYNMVTFVVPFSIYPKGYHANPKDQLPFISLAAQKNYISLYHLGLYSDENLMKWFVDEYSKTVKTKIDMGKSCIRFKKSEEIPFELISRLIAKVSVEEWIKHYETNIKK